MFIADIFKNSANKMYKPGFEQDQEQRHSLQARLPVHSRAAELPGEALPRQQHVARSS